MGFIKADVDEDEPAYIDEDDVYLYGKDKNGSLTRRPWYLLKPLGNHWFYYEYHTDEQ